VSAHAFIVRKDGTREELPSKKMIVLHPGDRLWEYIAGGAGYGDPLDRDPDLVLADTLDGKITAAQARAAYGVVLTAEGDAVDETATKDAREAVRRTRGPVTWLLDRGVDGRES
jgi:N-methylhydantoinase B